MRDVRQDNGYNPTPAEERLFKRHPELGKAMEELGGEERFRRMDKIIADAEAHLEESGKIIDKWKRELGV